MAATSTDGIVLATSATATSGNQKYSPALHFTGSGWKTNATAAAQAAEWRIDLQPEQGLANPIEKLVFASSTGGGALTSRWVMDGNRGTSNSSYGLFPGTGGGVGLIPFTNGDLLIATTVTSNFRFSDYSSGMTSVSDDAFIISSVGALAWSSITGATNNADLALMREGAANLRMGGVAANPPVAQTLSVQDASGTDIAGAAWTFRGSRGTGTGTPGTIVFRTSDTTASGTTLQTATTRLTISHTAVTSTLPVVVPGYTVATLPTGVTGMRAYVTDANATTFLSTVAGGGANTVPVFYNGTNWVIG